MSQPNPIYRFIYRQLIELRAWNKTYPDMIRKLESNGQVMVNRWNGKPDTPTNRATLGHIIGIERWGQGRLQTLMGEVAADEEYDAYRPEATISMAALIEVFLRTRAESVGCAHRLESSGVLIRARALHNDAGPLTVAGWLNYFIQHASIEGLRIRG